MKACAFLICKRVCQFMMCDPVCQPSREPRLCLFTAEGPSELTCSSGEPSQSLQDTHTHVRPSVTGKHERLTATCIKAHNFSALTGGERSQETEI